MPATLQPVGELFARLTPRSPEVASLLPVERDALLKPVSHPVAALAPKVDLSARIAPEEG